ncbi:MAG: hypothetical protein ACKVZ0_22020 [Gemmatimonadales bacterium]
MSPTLRGIIIPAMLRPPAPGAGTATVRLRRPRLGATAAGLMVLTSQWAAAQAIGSLGVGASYIRYDGFLASGAAVVAPGLRFDSRRVSVAGQGSWAVFESGNQVLQGTAALGFLAATSDRWRLELSTAAGVSKYASEASTGHLLGGARVHLTGRHAGAWVGATIGRTSGAVASAPIEAMVAGWSVRRRWSLLGSATVTGIGADRFLDLAGTIRWNGPIEVEARLGVRPWSRTGGNVGDPITGAFGEVTAQVPLASRLSLSLSGGSYPSDPVRRVLGASYLNAGLRLRAFGRDPAGPVPRLAAGREREPSLPVAGEARLQLARAGAHSTIRILASGVERVDLMADFTDWEVVSLRQVRPGVWEGPIPALEPGTHRLNVRLDGGPWIAPAGTRAEPNEFGGITGVIVVPPAER